MEQVNEAIAQVDEVTQGTAANSEETASASEQMASQAEELTRMMDDLETMVNGKGSNGGSGKAIEHVAHISRPLLTEKTPASEAAPARKKNGGKSKKRMANLQEKVEKQHADGHGAAPEELEGMKESGFSEIKA